MNKATIEGKPRLGSQSWSDAAEFKGAVYEWAEKIGVTPTRIQIQEMSRKWASCSPKGVLTFNKVLLSRDRLFGEAVIVHEVLHLNIKNHGPLFRSLFNAYFPFGVVVPCSEE